MRVTKRYSKSGRVYFATLSQEDVRAALKLFNDVCQRNFNHKPKVIVRLYSNKKKEQSHAFYPVRSQFFYGKPLLYLNRNSSLHLRLLFRREPMYLMEKEVREAVSVDRRSISKKFIIKNTAEAVFHEYVHAAYEWAKRYDRPLYERIYEEWGKYVAPSAKKRDYWIEEKFAEASVLSTLHPEHWNDGVSSQEEFEILLRERGLINKTMWDYGLWMKNHEYPVPSEKRLVRYKIYLAKALKKHTRT